MKLSIMLVLFVMLTSLSSNAGVGDKGGGSGDGKKLITVPPFPIADLE